MNCPKCGNEGKELETASYVIGKWFICSNCNGHRFCDGMTAEEEKEQMLEKTKLSKEEIALMSIKDFNKWILELARSGRTKEVGALSKFYLDQHNLERKV